MSIVYLHGFNSAPQSHKAQYMQRYMAERGLGDRFVCPKLPHRPDEAVALVEAEIARHPAGGATLVGSSLGGFYATHLAEKHGLRAVLLNPAVRPGRDLESYIGIQRNLYSGEAHARTRRRLAPARRRSGPSRALPAHRRDRRRGARLPRSGREVRGRAAGDRGGR
jgi:predicted esterase YcpF (UPF0227 family)